MICYKNIHVAASAPRKKIISSGAEKVQNAAIYH